MHRALLPRLHHADVTCELRAVLPGMVVMVCLPALMRSGYIVFGRKRPDPEQAVL
jgi:hypothetical protein